MIKKKIDSTTGRVYQEKNEYLATREPGTKLDDFKDSMLNLALDYIGSSMISVDNGKTLLVMLEALCDTIDDIRIETQGGKNEHVISSKIDC